MWSYKPGSLKTQVLSYRYALRQVESGLTNLESQNSYLFAVESVGLI